jgi:ATP-dependent DNA ligase
MNPTLQTTRQDYVDLPYAYVDKKQFDIVQLKYDGWWARVVVKDGKWTLFSRTERMVTSGFCDPSINGVFIGEYMFGTQWSQAPEHAGKIYFFDCWELNGVNTFGFGYRDRVSLFGTIKHLFAPHWQVVASYPFAVYAQLWDRLVLRGPYEGLVFRNKTDTGFDKVFRTKKTLTRTFLLVKVYEGEGEDAGRMGSVGYADPKEPTKELGTTGGGFSDALKQDIWDNPNNYIGRLMDVKANAVFESGSLRHPNFVRWRDDLKP